LTRIIDSWEFCLDLPKTEEVSHRRKRYTSHLRANSTGNNIELEWCRIVRSNAAVATNEVQPHFLMKSLSQLLIATVLVSTLRTNIFDTAGEIIALFEKR